MVKVPGVGFRTWAVFFVSLGRILGVAIPKRN